MLYFLSQLGIFYITIFTLFSFAEVRFSCFL